MNALTTLLFALLGAALTLTALQAVRPFLPRSPNYAGRLTPVSAGTSLICIILVTVAVAYSVAGMPGSVMAVYLLAAVIAGAVDDIWGNGGVRGFGGHVGAFLSGKITTGIVKLVVIGGGSVVVGLALYGFRPEALYGAFLLAGFANLGNLFDVRPGRSIKFMGVLAVLLVGFSTGEVAGVLAGTAAGILSLFYFDLKGRIMLGDAGASVVGSVPGLLVMTCGPGPVWWISGALVLGLTLIAEFSSISRLIEEVGVLRWLDLLGRVGRR